MKRLICMILSFVMLLGLAACGSKQEPAQTPAAPQTEGSADSGLMNDVTMPSVSAASTLLAPHIVAGDQTLQLDSSVGSYLDAGFTTDLDRNQEIPACETTDEFTLTYSGAILQVKAVNIYDQPAALEDCWVCSLYTEDTSDSLLLNKDIQCGKTSREDLVLRNLYSETENEMVYRGGFRSISIPKVTMDRKTVLESSNSPQYTFRFDNGVLQSFRVEDLDLEYQSMQNNMALADLIEMDPIRLDSLIQTRSLILLQLQQAMANGGVSVQVDDVSGQILMSNEILFDTDSAEISQAGKDYLDQFIKAYASVVLSEQYRTYIDSIHIEGHTDSRGDSDYNQKLSQARADAVMNYFLESSTVLTDAQKQELRQIAKAEGFGSSDLVYTDNGSEDMDASRRVAIKFFLSK